MVHRRRTAITALAAVLGCSGSAFIMRVGTGADNAGARQLRQDQPNPLRILSLGGSVTWGAMLQSRSSAYPHVLASMRPGSTVHNLAIRASGATYPSTCIQSMVEGAHDGEGVDEDYDVILLEFSINGLDGLDLLLRRLRRRYPNALIVYLELYSLGNGSFYLSKESKKAIGDVGAHFQRLEPRPKAMPPRGVGELRVWEGMADWAASEPLVAALFAEDWHHLGEKGHQHVANMINRIVDAHHHPSGEGQVQHSGSESSAQEGTWGLGDQCYFWFDSGEVSSGLTMEGGRMNDFVKAEKWAYEVQQGETAKFQFDVPATPDDGPEVPIYLAYMTKGFKYPEVDVDLNEGGKSHIDPLYEEMHKYHVTQMSSVGPRRTGPNQISVTPVEKKDWPFRVIGVSMCGACVEMTDGENSHLSLRVA